MQHFNYLGKQYTRINCSTTLEIVMGTAWATSEVLELPNFCKKKKCEPIGTQNSRFHQPQGVIGKVRGKQVVR